MVFDSLLYSIPTIEHQVMKSLNVHIYFSMLLQ